MSRFLVVLLDDNPIDINIIKWHLKGIDDPQYEVRAFFDPEQCLRSLAEERPDVCLVDFSLGATTTAFDFVQRLKEQHLEDIPVAVITGMHDDSIGYQLKMMGIKGYLDKNSFSAHFLDNSLRKIMAA